MNALNNPEVGKYINENFVSAFQKVATFQIVNGQKQGGNVAAYFCAPDGRVLHVVAGPVNATAMLRESKWVVETVRTTMKAANGDGVKFKQLFRTAHAEKLKAETGLAVEPVTFDAPETMADGDTLTYRDPSGQPLAPKLPPPPIDGPDVRLQEKEYTARQDAANAAPGARMALAKSGKRVVVNNQAVVHQLLAAHSMTKIEKVYGTIFESVLGEKVSTKPVEVKSPFSWMDRAGNHLGK